MMTDPTWSMITTPGGISRRIGIESFGRGVRARMSNGITAHPQSLAIADPR